MANEDRYIPYHAAKKLLTDRLGATPEEIAAWLFDGWCDDCAEEAEDKPAPAHVLRAYTHVEVGTPSRFVFLPDDGLNLAADMTCSYFDLDELNRFTPRERYIATPALIRGDCRIYRQP